MKKIFFLLCLAVVLMGCEHHHHEDEHEHEGHHHHEEAVLQLTAYGTHYELYAEATPFSVGNESDLLTHFTDLQDFSPISAGHLTVILSVGKEQVKVSTKKLPQPGIFKVHLTPKKTGRGTLLFCIKNAKNVIDTLKINNIEVFADAHEAEEAAEKQKIESPTAIAFTKEKSWKVDFATAQPEVRPFGQVIRAVAQIESAQADEMAVVAKNGGVLTFAAHDLLEGKAVAQGTSLFSVSAEGVANEDLALQREQARHDYDVAKQNYDRAKNLVEDKIVSQKDFAEYKKEYEKAKLTYDNLNKIVKGKGNVVTAPMSGYVKRILVKNGDYVATGQTLMTISKNKDLMVKVEIPQRYASLLSAIEDVKIESPMTHEVYSLAELNGSIISYGKSVADGGHLLPVNLKIGNVKDFLPGAFVTTWLVTNHCHDALVVPKTALTEEQGHYYVFVQLTPELFEKQMVTIGETDGTEVEIVSGLTAEQRIVTRGALLVKLAKSSGALDPHAGHVH